ncbi:hypothetical protein VWZ88_01715 [Phaeobacter sp. JH20_36]|uniref:hypothetical protein n=1 Tax=unclassified Phaeobacter TaxID=2621772 RepID=UPI003A8896C3
MRKLEINLHDSHIGIWQDDPNEPSFKEEVYGGLIRLLRDRGWTTHKDPEAKRNWASLSPNTRQAAKGNLRAHIQTAGRCVELLGISVDGIDLPSALSAWIRAARMSCRLTRARRATDWRPDCPYNGQAPLPPSLPVAEA